MTRSIHVRLDDASQAALAVVRAEGVSDSEAVRTALREAAERRRRRTSLQAEIAQLMGDDDDAEEMRAIREQMSALAPAQHD